jgi:membrane-associated phospholipid phosphatase
MKLNTKYSLQLISVIILLSAYHYFIHNRIEKIFSQTNFSYDSINRPLNRCNKKNNRYKLSCIGMPSCHAETSSVLCFLLYFYKFIPLWLCLTIIVIISLQRIVTNKHTLNQVLIGSILGFLYAIIYKKFNLSIRGFLIIFSIGLILTLLNVYKIDQYLNGKVSVWSWDYHN